MTDRELELRLADALERTAPDDLEAILSRCGVQNGSAIEMKELKRSGGPVDVDVIEIKPRKRARRWLAAACAALVLLGAGGGGLAYQRSHAVASVVSLDVNPSIELKVNRNEKVISCTALNTEAAAVLFDMNGGADLKGTKLDVAVNAIVGALVREGYLDSISSAILISVEDNDQARAARIQQEVVASVDGVLRVQAPNTSVLSQVVAQDAGAGYTWAGGNISNGKAAMVYRVMEMSGSSDSAVFDKRAVLSVEELNDLLKTGEKRIPIGKAAAASAAETYAGTLEISSVIADVDPELDKYPPHYEVDLETAWGEFEYIVDAFTGEVLQGQRDIVSLASTTPAVPQVPDTTPPTPDTQAPASQPAVTAPTQQSGDIGRDAAKKAALDHAGVTEAQATWTKVEREWDDGRLEYEVEFWSGTTEYDYTIDGQTGAVLKQESDYHSGNGVTGSANDIGREAAKSTALNHAGVTEGQTSRLKVERDWDDGRLEYEVEFYVGWTEYEYTIDGSTGAILEYEFDYDD